MTLFKASIWLWLSQEEGIDYFSTFEGVNHKRRQPEDPGNQIDRSKKP